MKSVYPERLLGSRWIFVSVQLQSWSPAKFHNADTLPVTGQQRGITAPAAEFPTPGSCEELCVAMVVQRGDSAWD